MGDVRDPVRVALVGCSGLLGDIIAQTVASEPGLAIVADLPAEPLRSLDRDLDVDLVLWNDADEQVIAQWLRGTRRCPRVLGTLVDGQGAVLWEMVPRRTELAPLSPQTLVQTIRETERQGS